VTLDATTYAGGFAAGTAFEVSIGGFRNPRTVEPSGTFSFATTDSDGYSIDASNTNFIVTMTSGTLSQLVGVDVELSNKTNGALADYTIQITANTEVY